MKPLIPPAYYFDHELFKQEQVLFQNLWNFVGFTTDLQNHNDYICTEVGGKSVVIQNFHGELKAFTNVCSHRFSQIRQQPKGNGTLRCPYHSWVYNSEGIPVGIPHQAEFEDLTDATKEALRLERWHLETCGILVFVKRHDDSVALKDYLQGTYDSLKDVSEAVGIKVAEKELVIDANWKIILENTLEGYHVASIHENTFAAIGMGAKDKAKDIAENQPQDYGKFGMNGIHPYSISSPLRMDSRAQNKSEKVFETRKIKENRYIYYLAFPNCTVGITRGIHFTIHRICPLSPSQTKIIMHMYYCKLDSNIEQVIVDMGSNSFIEYANKVWHEDKYACEQVQLGISSMERNGGILSGIEQLIYEFHKVYVKMMNCSEVSV